MRRAGSKRLTIPPAELRVGDTLKLGWGRKRWVTVTTVENRGLSMFVVLEDGRSVTVMNAELVTVERRASASEGASVGRDALVNVALPSSERQAEIIALHSYDERCLELANVFLDDEPYATDFHKACLAQAIQVAIEDYLAATFGKEET